MRMRSRSRPPPSPPLPRLQSVRLDIVTIFPAFFGVLDVSLLGRARAAGLIDVGVHELRDATHDRHRTVDDTPYGGGAGMVMKPEPWGELLDTLVTPSSVLIVPSPAGHPFTQATARELSIGDYVLNGGEVATMAMIEAIGRLVPGVVGNPESLTEESHEQGLLEYPSYTKPPVWRDRAVPEVLLSGNHGAIAAWRHEQQLARTRAVRPDLLEGR